MTDILLQDREVASWPEQQERRRPGRIDNASPKLIAIMRKPVSATSRVQVALYDAPGFLLASAPVRRPAQRNYAAGAAAFVASGALWAVMFKMMVWAWG